MQEIIFQERFFKSKKYKIFNKQAEEKG